MISHSDSITNLMGAMLKVQGQIDGVKKDTTNPHFKKAYASLESVVDTIRPECQKVGIVVTQAVGEFKDNCITLHTMLVHAESGEWMHSIASLPVAKTDPQGVGSALTYAERYSLMAAFNLPPVDDDGNAASANGAAKPKPATVNPAWQERQKADNLIKAMKGAKSIDDLDALIDDAKELPDALKQEARNAYTDRKRAFDRMAGQYD